MVTKPKNLRELIASEIIRSVSDTVCERTKSPIFPTYNDTMFEATRDYYEKSGIPIKELYELLTQDRDQFIHYSCALVLNSRGTAIEQEYPPSERPSKAEAWVVRKELGLAKDFIIRHLIVYWFVTRNPSGFESYLKATRTPNAKKQAKRLMQLGVKQNSRSRP